MIVSFFQELISWPFALKTTSAKNRPRYGWFILQSFMSSATAESTTRTDRYQVRIPHDSIDLIEGYRQREDLTTLAAAARELMVVGLLEVGMI